VVVAGSNGTLVKTANSPTVYLIVNGKLRPFTSGAIFLAHGLKFTDIQIISDDQITAANLGRIMGYPDGTLIKGSTPTVYQVLGDTKLGIPSMAVFLRLNLLLKNILILTDSDLASYDEGAVVQ
jgi:site-specific DNA-cytosine methylase